MAAPDRFAAVAARHAGLACGVLGWSPDQFWAATPADLRLAWHGWLRAAGHDPDLQPLSRADCAALLARLAPEETRDG